MVVRKAEIEPRLELRSGPIRIGAVVQAQLALTPKRAYRVREATVGIVCEEWYDRSIITNPKFAPFGHLPQQTVLSARGHHRLAPTPSAIVWRDHGYLFEGVELFEGQPAHADIEIAVPAEIATAERPNPVVRRDWHVEIHVDVVGARDIEVRELIQSDDITRGR